MNDDTVAASEVIPLMIRMSAIDVIDQLLQDSYSIDDGAVMFRQKVEGVIAMVHEVERRCKSE